MQPGDTRNDKKTMRESETIHVLQKQLMRLKFLREIDKAILNTTARLDETLKIVLDGSLQLLNAHHGQLFLLESDKLVVVATTTKPAERELGKRLKVDNSASGLAVERKSTVIIANVDQEPRYQRMLDEEYMRSEIAVPLVQNGRLFGVLNIESPVLNAFSKHDKDILETLAGQAAIAIIRTQEQLELRQTRMIKGIGKTASWLVHKIGNIALNIQWPAERLIEEVDPNDESQQEDLQMILDGAYQIIEMKKALLKPIQRSVNLDSVSVGDTVKKAMENVNAPHSISHIDIPADLPLVKTDGGYLIEIFEELYHNALDAMQNAAEKNVMIKAYVHQDKTCIEIKFADTGTGIHPEAIDEVWAIGFTTKQEQSGTGLGLYMVAQAMDQMGAKIFVESIVDRGTTFTIRIPIWVDNGNPKK